MFQLLYNVVQYTVNELFSEKNICFICLLRKKVFQFFYTMLGYCTVIIHLSYFIAKT